MSRADHRDSRSIERELDATRHRLDQDLELLMRRMSPGDIAERAVGFLKEGDGAQMGRNLATQVRDKPLALALVGAGLAWLMTGRSGNGYSGSYGSSGSSASNMASGLAEHAGNAASGVSGAASHLGKRLGDTAGAVGGGLQSAGGGARDVGQSTWTAMQENPILAAAIGITAGAALAALLPPTQIEEEHLGPAIDKASEHLREQAKPAMERMKETAGRTADAAMGAAREQVEGQRGEGNAQRATGAGESAVRAVKSSDAQHNVGHPPTVS